MRILFIVPYPPSLIRTRSYNLVRHLAQRGHNIVLLTLTSSADERRDALQMETYCERVITAPLAKARSWWNCLRALPTATPLQAVYCWQPALAAEITALLATQDEPFDVIHVEHMRGARYALHIVRTSGDRRPPIVWDSVDCISLLFRQASGKSKSFFGKWITRLESARTESYEGWLQSQFDHVLVTSPIDGAELKSLHNASGPAAPISVIPNGVNLDYFKPDPTITREPATLVFSGKMSYHANVTMALYLVEEIMPHVWAKRPDVQLLIVGKDPPRAIQSLNERQMITITGTVPDIRPYLQRATMAVVPLLYGAGSQFKVLEAMACGIPVIATGKAVEPLAVVPGTDVLVADEPEGFAQAILTLLQNEAQRNAVGAAGLQYVCRDHDWKAIAAKLEALYMQLL